MKSVNEGMELPASVHVHNHTMGQNGLGNLLSLRLMYFGEINDNCNIFHMEQPTSHIIAGINALFLQISSVYRGQYVLLITLVEQSCICVSFCKNLCVE